MTRHRNYMNHRQIIRDMSAGIVGAAAIEQFRHEFKMYEELEGICDFS